MRHYKPNRSDTKNQPRRQGFSRESSATCVPPHVNAALKRMARKEGRSVSWMRARIIYDWFGLDETGWFAKDERKP